MNLITLDAMLVTILISTVLPILVGVVTKLTSSSGLKATALLLLSGLQGLVVSSVGLDGTAVISKETALLALVGWVTAVASYHGLLKPTTITTKVQEATASIGVG